MQAGSIQIRMDVLDWTWRPARHPRDVHMRMSQQDAQRFPSHVAATSHDTHAYHSVLSSPVCLMDALSPSCSQSAPGWAATALKTLALTVCLGETPVPSLAPCASK